jgi:hypothetical protein
MIQARWENLRDNPDYKPIRSAIEAALVNVTKWYKRLNDTDCYILCMALNPVLKLAYVHSSGNPEYIRDVEDIVKKAVSEFLMFSPTHYDT